jgi:DNA-binding transcriptional regulator YdaS (Cro superfamily)
MRLKEWLTSRERRRENVADVAHQLGVARSTLYEWAGGKRMPPPQKMREIEALTGGSVTPQDFLHHALERAA